jgi:biotin carboxylase
VFDVTPPETDSAASIRDVERLLALEQNTGSASTPILFPLDDAAVWVCSRTAADQRFVLAGPRGKMAELALSKTAQLEVARTSGFEVLPTRIARNRDEALGADLVYPLFLKPAEAISHVGNRLTKGHNGVCANRNELEHFVKKWNGVTPLLIQPYVSGTGEGVFGIATHKGLEASSGHQRLRMMNPHGSGSSACESVALTEDLSAAAERFIKQSGWRGLFMIELLRDAQGKVWFVEFNGRPWGSLALARRQGLEYPAWNIQLALDAHWSVQQESVLVSGLVCRNAGRELLHPLFVLRGPKSTAIEHWPSFWNSVAGVARFNRKQSFYNWRKDDLKVFVADCFYTFCDNVFKTRRRQ